MDNVSELNLAPKAKKWDCSLVKTVEQKKITVGERSLLKCTGAESVLPQDGYVLELPDSQQYFYKILEVTKDTSSEKDFVVASYAAHKNGAVFFKVKNNSDELLFESYVKDSAVESLLTSKDKEPTAPGAGYYLYPTVLEAAGILAIFFAIVGLIVTRQIRRSKKVNEFNQVLRSARHEDPFMEFSFDVRELKKMNISPGVFFDKFENALRKLFFKVLRTRTGLSSLSLIFLFLSIFFDFPVFSSIFQ